MTLDDRPVILFDLDGTVLDSAPGIVACLQAAMSEVGLDPADERELRADLGPPPAIMLAQVGVQEQLIPPAVQAYRRYYSATGLQNARIFRGVGDALVQLGQDYRLATATMKLIETATAFLAHHQLLDHFEVVGGAHDDVFDKSTIIAATRTALGDPPAEAMIMVGDRHSDITGGRANGLRTIGVTWGYGSREELAAAGPDLIIERPDQLAEAAGLVLDQLPV